MRMLVLSRATYLPEEAESELTRSRLSRKETESWTGVSSRSSSKALEDRREFQAHGRAPQVCGPNGRSRGSAIAPDVAARESDSR
jgi:hypothetical protein